MPVDHLIQQGTNHIFLTGGTGFFGRALLRYFLSVGESQISTITILSRNPDSFLKAYPEFAGNPLIFFKKGNICDRASLPWGENYTHFIHAATDSTLGHILSPLERYMQIVDGTRNILELAVETGARRFLLTSSGAIYGPESASLDSISEDVLSGPSFSDCRSAYCHGKRSVEHLSALFGNEYGFDIVVARCFTFAGPDLPLDAHFAIGNFIRSALTEDGITVKGDGAAVRTYLDQTDLSRWLFTLLFKGRSHEAYNVGSDDAISISNLAYMVRDILSPDKDVRFLGKSVPGIAPSRYVPNIQKIREELGLQITVTLAESIRSTARSLRSQ